MAARLVASCRSPDDVFTVMRQRWGDVRRSLEWLERVAPICRCDCCGRRCCISFIGMWVSGADGLDSCRLCVRVLVIDACVRRRYPPVYPGTVPHPASRHGVNPSSKLAGGIHATNGLIPDAAPHAGDFAC
ncbi:hypothetical protein NY98_07010 [Xanthomonas citri pv. fuscans]|uniref:Uncharacterized protein n=1 Tax=Xanthomonas citri pv. fuscans TaxID=366649 RepID=A0AB34Q8F9_XANCI|nr:MULTISPECIES: hypothetical protein [Xanthomonas]AZU16305.1 hypothetical protein AC613_04140 [Xanthomonas citri pv. fuscans]AZU20439.1 hypothetical protein AC612_04140 [Xanthomonas citri pv. fuscans]AZU91567.1 hypothetical protein AC614_04145 [Xanthomonas citri pv. fuscans]KGK63924.1 hypothetical protein NB99_22385 [Xanthomonas citri pv. fuscans]KGP23617.1 hypothetical protein NY65_17765 [Xanthomonas phaseoli pv. phaseoli]